MSNKKRETKGELDRLKATLQKLQAESKDLIKREKDFEKQKEEAAKREKSLRDSLDSMASAKNAKDNKVFFE